MSARVEAKALRFYRSAALGTWAACSAFELFYALACGRCRSELRLRASDTGTLLRVCVLGRAFVLSHIGAVQGAWMPLTGDHCEKKLLRWAPGGRCLGENIYIYLILLVDLFQGMFFSTMSRWFLLI